MITSNILNEKESHTPHLSQPGCGTANGMGEVYPLDTPGPCLPPTRQQRRAAVRESVKAARALTPRELQATVTGGVHEYFFTAGLQALTALLEEDADTLCGGPKGKHLGGERKARRHGYELGFVHLGSGRLPLPRPRVRSLVGEDRELELPTYRWAQQDGGIRSTQVEAACLAGVSQRGYEAVAREFIGEPHAALSGLSRSAVGRRFIGATKRQLERLEQRRLDGKRPLVLYIDGLGLGNYTVLAAVVLYADGTKVLAGVQEGTTENSEVCQEFLQKLVSRGLSTEDGLLVVIDGGKGIAAGVKAVLGSRAAIQRCRVHKKRNVLEKLPEASREAISARLTALWSLDDVKQAESGLTGLAEELERLGHPEAANSLREGLTETTTCQRLELPANSRLTRSVSNTNVIESSFSAHERISHRVRNWRHGEMAVRWAAAALLVAEKAFSPVGSELELARLGRALSAHVRPRAGRSGEKAA